MSAIKFEAARIHFLSDVCVAVAVALALCQAKIRRAQSDLGKGAVAGKNSPPAFFASPFTARLHCTIILEPGTGYKAPQSVNKES